MTEQSQAAAEDFGATATLFQRLAAGCRQHIARQRRIVQAVAEIRDRALGNSVQPLKAHIASFLLHHAAHGAPIAMAFVILLDKQAAQLRTGILWVWVDGYAAHNRVV